MVLHGGRSHIEKLLRLREQVEACDRGRRTCQGRCLEGISHCNKVLESICELQEGFVSLRWDLVLSSASPSVDWNERGPAATQPTGVSDGDKGHEEVKVGRYRMVDCNNE